MPYIDKETKDNQMPFRSIAQQKFLFSQHPEVAEEFSEHTPKSAYKKLPEHVSDKNRLKEYTKKHRRSRRGI
jgi:hypothetical protein